MTIGIDKIGFATSQYVLRLSELAAARNTDPEKLSKGLLLKELSIALLQRISSHLEQVPAIVF